MTDITAGPITAPAPVQGKGYWRLVGERILRDKVTLVVAAVLVTIVLIAIFAPLVTSYDPYTGKIGNRLQPIGTPGHWLGTDEVGRDLWTRLAYGARLSLLTGVTPVFFATLIGGTLGIVAGIGGRIPNTIIMRTMDVFYAFPSVLLAIAICGVLGAGLFNTMLSLTIVFIPPLVRVSESLTTQVRSLDFVEAARATGASLAMVIRHQVIANVLSPILVYATSLVSISIILAAGLSFLGLGVAPPAAEWGAMLNALRQSIYVNPVNAALPGFVILATSMSFNLISDGLRSAMDVRLPR
ncbi:ABC transporter permease [Prosthecomicrobium sp. N25]|uniref:ABC transporter permease n=1 Tax=Prosthecomicrobium sp. N25 TaxID=3129254 RepID=UPI003077296B